MSEDFSLEALDGKKVSLSSFKGKVVLLSFWATWCGPCKQEMPAMEKLYQKLKGRGFEVVAVDMMEDRATVAAFVKTSGYTFPVLLDTTGEVGGNGLYAARAIPTNYIVDKAGKIVGRKIGIDGPAWTSDERIARVRISPGAVGSRPVFPRRPDSCAALTSPPSLHAGRAQ